MAKAILNIRGYAVDRLEIVPREGEYDPSAAIICQVGLQFAVAADLGEHQFRVRLHVRLHDEGLQMPPNLPYLVNLEIQGLFDTHLKLMPDAIPAQLAQNALTVLYGTARGIVGQASSTFSNGPVVLPAVTFDAIVEKASRDAATAIIPTPDSVRVTDPAAPIFFRFHFAIEDLPQIALLIPDEESRALVLDRIREMVTALNTLPLDPPSGLQMLHEALKSLGAAIDDVADPLASVMRIYLSYLNAGAEQLRIADAKLRVAVAETESESAESPIAE